MFLIRKNINKLADELIYTLVGVSQTAHFEIYFSISGPSILYLMKISSFLLKIYAPIYE